MDNTRAEDTEQDEYDAMVAYGDVLREIVAEHEQDSFGYAGSDAADLAQNVLEQHPADVNPPAFDYEAGYAALVEDMPPPPGPYRRLCQFVWEIATWQVGQILGRLGVPGGSAPVSFHDWQGDLFRPADHERHSQSVARGD